MLSLVRKMELIRFFYIFDKNLSKIHYFSLIQKKPEKPEYFLYKRGNCKKLYSGESKFKK